MKNIVVGISIVSMVVFSFLAITYHDAFGEGFRKRGGQYERKSTWTGSGGKEVARDAEGAGPETKTWKKKGL